MESWHTDWWVVVYGPTACLHLNVKALQEPEESTPVQFERKQATGSHFARNLSSAEASQASGVSNADLELTQRRQAKQINICTFRPACAEHHIQMKCMHSHDERDPLEETSMKSQQR